MLRNPVNAAKQEHEGKLYDAGWQPIRTGETHEKIQRFMDRKVSRCRGKTRCRGGHRHPHSLGRRAISSAVRRCANLAYVTLAR
jgi:hypothetical protein